MSKDIFSSRSCGKWILTGEHILVRGGHAVSFPLKELCLDIQYKPNQPLSFLFEGEFSDSEKNKYFENAVKKAFENVRKKANREFLFIFKDSFGLWFRQFSGFLFVAG